MKYRKAKEELYNALSKAGEQARENGLDQFDFVIGLAGAAIATLKTSGSTDADVERFFVHLAACFEQHDDADDNDEITQGQHCPPPKDADLHAS